MILRSLRLRNFRRFADVSVEFPDGVVGVLGLNGVGKSSLFEAMAWALYGSVASRTGVEGIKRQGAAGSEPCRVELEFAFDGHAYRVVREMVGRHLTAAAQVTVDGRLAASGAEAVSRFVEGRLGMDCKSFYTSIFARQKELNALSSMNPSERRPLILRMLGISVLDSVVGSIRSDARDKEKAVEAVSHELVDATGGKVLDRLLAQRQGLDGQRAVGQTRILEAKEAVNQAEATHAAAVASAETSRGSYEESQRRREQAEGQKHAFERLQRLREEEASLTKLVADRAQKQAKAADQVSQYASLNTDLAEVERSLKAVVEKIERVVRSLEQKATLSQRCLQEQREAEKKRSEIRRIGPDAQCPTCARELGAQYTTLIEHYDGLVKAAENQVAVYRKVSVALEREQASVGRQRQALEKKQQYLHSRQLEAASLKTTVKNLESELKRERLRLTAIAKDIATLDMVVFDERGYAAAVKAAKDAYDRYQKALGQQSLQRSTLETCRLQLHSRESELQVLSEQERSLKERIVHQEALQRQVQEALVEEQRLSMLGEVMGRFRTHLIAQVRPTLSGYASDLLSQLSDGKYTLLEFDDDYNISVYDNGQAFGIERFSGGEEDLANLCTRLAISEIISERAGSSFDFVVLDEIFGSQDSGRRRNILAALGGFSAKFRQIFLVTHIEDIKDSVEHIISIAEDENGVSTLHVE